MRDTVLAQVEALGIVTGIKTAISGDDSGTNLLKLSCASTMAEQVWDYLVGDPCEREQSPGGACPLA